MKKLNNKGFTLVELIATVAILLVIGSIVTYSVINIVNTGKEKSEVVLSNNIIDAGKMMFEEIENASYIGDSSLNASVNVNTDNSKTLTTDIATLGKYGYLSVNGCSGGACKVSDAYNVDVSSCEIKITRYTDCSNKIMYSITPTNENNCSNLDLVYSNTSDENKECYISVSKPDLSCNDKLIADGTYKNLTNATNTSAYTIINNKKKKTGSYTVSAVLNHGYKWSDESNDDVYENPNKCTIYNKTIAPTKEDVCKISSNDGITPQLNYTGGVGYSAVIDNNNVDTSTGYVPVKLKLDDGYIWDDESLTDKTFDCSYNFIGLNISSDGYQNLTVTVNNYKSSYTLKYYLGSEIKDLDYFETSSNNQSNNFFSFFGGSNNNNKNTNSSGIVANGSNGVYRISVNSSNYLTIVLLENGTPIYKRDGYVVDISNGSSEENKELSINSEYGIDSRYSTISNGTVRSSSISNGTLNIKVANGSKKFIQTSCLETSTYTSYYCTYGTITYYSNVSVPGYYCTGSNYTFSGGTAYRDCDTGSENWNDDCDAGYDRSYKSVDTISSYCDDGTWKTISIGNDTCVWLSDYAAYSKESSYCSSWDGYNVYDYTTYVPITK